MKIVISRSGAWELAPQSFVRTFAERKGIECYPIVGDIDYDADDIFYSVAQTSEYDFLSSKLPDKEGRLESNAAIYLAEYRTDPVLIQMVEEGLANMPYFGFELKVVEIPDDVKWRIAEYRDDMSEYIEEEHRIWR